MEPDRKSTLRSSYMMMGALGGFIAGAILLVVWIVWLAYYFEGDASPLFWRLAILGGHLLLTTAIIVGLIAGRILFFRRVDKPGREGR